ncbi:ABC transporter substrate-binding protein [Brachybacterium saurashtrense]|uniref:ABC transporter substrate-binding protein n=1 Tax=Brachybacterium saurashtrense TaxID=556288 RepID=A0A345YKB6_9MICO|nr:ABC transporter substrate-binding protein [Brachybacterium saurashtrense]AXK44368.1 ABC transporter substrate-binding protein [Brachybacterium saurashtrense]RRR21310.1 ABC transporter substrate-binding protein [Brachybacterium saurashtrense]RRR22979.1 ABC transporter substrate-binding protein [Brachybacterium saurashtrense]
MSRRPAAPSRRGVLQGLGAGALGLAALPLAGCSADGARADGGAPGTAGTADTADESELSFLISNLDGGWVPSQSSISSYEANVWQQLTDKLVHTSADGVVSPWIAADWEQDAEAREYVLHLREGVTFSDGTPLDAAAVVANLDSWAVGRPEEGIARVGLFPGSTYAGAEALDALTVRVSFTAPTLSFLPTLGYHGCQLMAPSSIALSLEEQSDLSAQIGSGPFVLESWSARERVRLVRREDYDWAPEVLGASGPARLAAITYTVLPDDTLRASAARAGQTDIAYNVNPQVLDSFTEAGFVIEVPRYLGFVHGYSLRTSAAPFDDVRVRQAVTRGIDRAEILRTVFTDAWEPATSWLQAGIPETTDLRDTFEYAPELAASLLDEAGWTGRTADGIRTRDGVELGFTIYPTPYLTGSVPEAELISQHLGRLGFRVGIQKVDIPTWAERVTNDPTQGVAEVTRSFVDVGTVAGVVTDEGEDWFQVGSTDAELVRLRDEVAGAASRQERAGLVEELSRHVLEQAYFVPLEQNVQRIYVQSPRLSGITFNAVAIPSYHAAVKEPS